VQSIDWSVVVSFVIISSNTHLCYTALHAHDLVTLTIHFIMDNYETRFGLALASTTSESAANNTESTPNVVTWEEFKGWHDAAVASSNPTRYHHSLLEPELAPEIIEDFSYGDIANLQYRLPIDSVEPVPGPVQNIGSTGTFPSNVTPKSVMTSCEDTAGFQYRALIDYSGEVTGPIQNIGSTSAFNDEHAAVLNYVAPQSAMNTRVNEATKVQPQQSFHQANWSRHIAPTQHGRTNDNFHGSLHNSSHGESSNAGNGTGNDLSHA
jgi:hypothetical protein